MLFTVLYRRFQNSLGPDTNRCEDLPLTLFLQCWQLGGFAQTFQLSKTQWKPGSMRKPLLTRDPYSVCRKKVPLADFVSFVSNFQQNVNMAWSDQYRHLISTCQPCKLWCPEVSSWNLGPRDELQSSKCHGSSNLLVCGLVMKCLQTVSHFQTHSKLLNRAVLD